MAFTVPHEGDVQILTELLGAGENWLLGLFKTAITPAETDVADTYTANEADFSGYARLTLTRTIASGTWSPPVSQAPSGDPAWSSRTQVGHSAYGSSPQSWTCGATGGDVHGYFILGATSGKLILAEAFPAAKTLASGDSLAMTPIFESA